MIISGWFWFILSGAVDGVRGTNRPPGKFNAKPATTWLI